MRLPKSGAWLLLAAATSLPAMAMDRAGLPGAVVPSAISPRVARRVADRAADRGA
ncbi:MAG: hypothetical protein ACOY4T_04470 [Pseudomonadota bacterium]